jgi:hypothetical protein
VAQSNFAELTGVASTASIVRGVSTGRYAAPNGGGSRVFEFASQDNGTGGVALYCALPGVNPTAKGGQISAALQRGPSAGYDSFAVFLFAQLTNTNMAGVAYMLGLGNADPSHVVVRKGDLASGLPDLAPGTQGVLARSSATYPVNVWYHLMLEIVVNANDVVINGYQSFPTLHPVGSPIWTPIPGLTSIIDDPLGVNTGSAPLTAGSMGYGFWSSDVARVGLVDYVRPVYQ